MAETAGLKSCEHTVPRLYRLDEVADLCQVTRRCLEEWIAAGRLRALRIGPKTRRIAEDDLLTFLDEARAQGGTLGG